MLSELEVDLSDASPESGPTLQRPAKPVGPVTLGVSTRELEAAGAKLVADDANPTLMSEGVEPTSSRSGSSRYRAGVLIAGRYRLVERLGAGGAGEVWLAEHVLLNTRVAIKFALESLSDDSERTKLLSDRFRLEAQISAQLGSKTRHIVLVQDAGRDHTGPFVVMEYAPGKNLDEVIGREISLAPDRVARIIEQIADALSVAHAAGVLHRDLKPANVLLVEDEQGLETAKLADFGIAKAKAATLRVDQPRNTGHGYVVGTPDYMSPERLRGASDSETADLWALAVVAYEALTGTSPFRRPRTPSTMLAVLTQNYEAPSRRVPRLGRAVDAWFKRAFHENPERRFASAKEMSDAFATAVGAKKKVMARRGPSALVATALTLLVVVGAVLVPSRLPTTTALGASESDQHDRAAERRVPIVPASQTANPPQTCGAQIALPKQGTEQVPPRTAYEQASTVSVR